MAHRPTADVGLGDAGHLDGALHPRVLAGALEGVLQRQRVHDRAEHADVIALGGIHALHRPLAATPEVATTDHDGYIDPHLSDGHDVAGSDIESVTIESLAGLAGQCLA